MSILHNIIHRALIILYSVGFWSVKWPKHHEMNIRGESAAESRNSAPHRCILYNINNMLPRYWFVTSGIFGIIYEYDSLIIHNNIIMCNIIIYLYLLAVPIHMRVDTRPANTRAHRFNRINRLHHHPLDNCHHITDNNTIIYACQIVIEIA